MGHSVAEHIDALRRNVAEHGSAVVAFSAGVDSTLVLKIARDVLGDSALAVTGLSPSVAPAECRDAERVAAAIGARLEFAPTDEMDDPRYVANGNDRCFWCKSELYDVCQRVAQARGLDVVLNGTNADDLGDYRPGLRAAEEAGVRAPLLECGLGKEAVRAVARSLGLPNWDKPADACLASRLPHGTAVTAERLAAVDAVETHLRERGFRQVRARHHGSEVSLEVAAERVPGLLAATEDPKFHAVLRRSGFRGARVALDGYRQGRLNPAPSFERERSA